MAIARLSVGTGSKGKASPHAQYIAREGKYQKPSTHQEKLENTGYGNMPQWAEHNPNYFWQCADEHERKNGSTYREHVIALPRELDEQQRHELVKDWIKSEIGDKHAYQYAIHNPPAMDGKEQPHCHLMFSERTRDGIERDPDQYFKRYNSKNPDRGGAKKANTGLSHAERKADLIAQRDRWEKLCNQHLERAGHYERISMKSLKEQGINREPLNIPMHQMNKPQVKETYKAMLEAKEQAFQAKIDVLTALEGTPLVEINRQLREQERKTQQEKQAQRQARIEQFKAEQRQKEKLAQQQAQKRTTSPTERPQQPQATQAPPPPPEPPNRADEIERKRQAVQQFEQKTADMAEKIHKYELQELRATAKPLLAEIEQMRDNKPLNPFKHKAWQQGLDEKLEQYNKIKANHDSKKANGVTAEHRQTAYALYYKNAPDTYDQIREFSQEISEYDAQQAEIERQQRLAELEQRRQERAERNNERGNDKGMER